MLGSVWRQGICLGLVFSILFMGGFIQANEIQVVTTFSILEDFVREIGGERVVVQSLVPIGADPHSWEATPKEIRLVAQADLLVANGGGFDAWLIPLAKNAASVRTPLIFALEGEPMIHEHDHDHDHDHDYGHEHEGDEHLWLSIPHAISYVQRITEALIEVSPADASYFTARLAVYKGKLEELDREIQEQFSRIPVENRVLVSYHNAFSHFAERYGFRVAHLVENPEAEPSPRDLSRVVQLLKQQKNPVVFTEPQISVGYRYMQTLAKEVQGTVLTLYSDSLSSDVQSYIDLMQYNAKTIVEALQ